MQSNCVKAFRQRLVRAGFTDVCIYGNYRGSYRVTCVSPEGQKISEDLTEVQMASRPFVVWFL